MKKRNKYTPHITTTYEKIQHNANLCHEWPQAPQVARKGRIDIDKTWWLIDVLFNSNPMGSISLELEAKPHEALVIRDIDKLLRVSFVQDTEDDKTIEVNSHSTPYLVEFFADEIVDCRIVETSADGRTDSVFPVDYTIHIIRNGERIASETYKIEVRIDQIVQYKPEVVFQPDKDHKGGIEFNSLQKDPVLIGYLVVKNAGTLFRTPALTLELAVSASIDDVVYPELLSFGDDDQAIVTYKRPLLNPFLETKTNTSNLGTSSRCCTKIRKTGKKVRIDKLPVVNGDKKAVMIPVLLHMSEIKKNPVRDSLIAIETVSTFRRWYDPDSVKNTQVDNDLFEIKKNTTLMELEVFAGPEGALNNQLYRLKTKETRILSAEYSGSTAEGQRHSMLTFELGIANSATAVEEGKENAGIYVKNLLFDPPIPINGTSIILDEGKALTDMFHVSNPLLGKELLRAPDDPIKVSITYTDEFLKEIRQNGQIVYESFVIIPVSFDYYLDEDGSSPNDPKYSNFEATLQFRVIKRARPEWFCLDFGTSAVVASYAKSVEELADRRLIRLEDMKNALMARVWSQPKMREDVGEGSPYLISSATVLQDKDVAPSLSQINIYGNSAVLFSPPSIGYSEYYNRLLPCLKSLVGNDTIPNELIPPGTRHRDDTSLKVRVNDVLTLIYRQLFQFFIPDRILREAHRLVLSFPNTFSPVHRQIIKKIASASLPNLRSNYLRFVSESDAVAFYYNHHRNSFKLNSESLIKGLGDAFDRHVLVYDMGAGTLDLTYFTRSKIWIDENRSRIRIAIEGKMGVNKAGNYLDYVLAEILVGLFTTDEKVKGDKELVEKLHSLLEIKRSDTGKWLSEASKLKDYVKYHLKPNLNKDDEQLGESLSLFGTEMPLNHFKINDIVSDKRYKTFLKDVTDDVFQSFVDLFGKGEAESRHLPIDMVIFSGRTTCIRSLRKAVKEYLSVFGKQDRECLFADLSSKRLFYDIESQVEDITSLKTVVVDGALAYCRGKTGFELINNNVYPTYGVFFVNDQNGCDWLPLIDFRTKAVPGKESVSDDGITIKEYDTRRYRAETTSHLRPDAIDFSNYETILIVQTYSKSPQKDWENKREEMTSVIGTIDISDDDRCHCIYMRINDQNELIFNIDNESQHLLLHDNYESDSYAKSMWPIIRVRKALTSTNSHQIE